MRRAALLDTPVGCIALTLPSGLAGRLSRSGTARAQFNPEVGAVRRDGRRRDLAIVAFDDLPAHRQTQPHSIRLCRHERLEYGAELLRIDTGPSVPHFDRKRTAMTNTRRHLQPLVAA